MTGTTGISKVWAFFKPAFTNQADVKRNGLTCFKNEWGQLTEDDREQIRTGIENDTLTYK
jgi:hypothetical protein